MLVIAVYGPLQQLQSPAAKSRAVGKFDKRGPLHDVWTPLTYRSLHAVCHYGSLPIMIVQTAQLIDLDLTGALVQIPFKGVVLASTNLRCPYDPWDGCEINGQMARVALFQIETFVNARHAV